MVELTPEEMASLTGPQLSGERWNLAQEGEPNQDGRDWSYSLFRGKELRWRAYPEVLEGRGSQDDILILKIHWCGKEYGDIHGWERQKDYEIADHRLYCLLLGKYDAGRNDRSLLDDRTRHAGTVPVPREIRDIPND